jgi:hypothetical protein
MPSKNHRELLLSQLGHYAMIYPDEVVTADRFMEFVRVHDYSFLRSWRDSAGSRAAVFGGC